MRIAIISLSQEARNGAGPRALLPIASSHVAGRQTELALDADADKVLFHAETVAGQLLALQNLVEKRGKTSGVIRSGRELAQHVAPADEVMLVADGLYVDPATHADFFAQPGPALAVLIDDGAPEMFERLDINHRWAGLARLKGADMHALGELPADWDLVSAAVRLAAERKYPFRTFEASRVGDTLVPVESGEAAEKLADRLMAWGATRPGESEKLLVLPLARSLAPRIWRDPRIGTGIGVGALLAGFAAVLCAAQGWIVAALLLAILALAGGRIVRVARSVFGPDSLSGNLMLVVRGLTGLVVLLGLFVYTGELALAVRLYVAVSAPGMLWLWLRQARAAPSAGVRWLGDVNVLLLIGLVAGLLGLFVEAVLAMAAGALLAAILLSLARWNAPLTRH